MSALARPDRRLWLATLPAAVAAAAAVASMPAAAEPALIDWPALVTIDGQPIAAASWQGVPAILVFWATYCGFCKRHNAHIDALFQQVDAARLRILGVVMDTDRAGARQAVQSRGYHFPMVVDDGRLRRRFTLRRVMPMTCTVGADSRLQQCIPGEMAEDDVRGLARLALRARP